MHDTSPAAFLLGMIFLVIILGLSFLPTIIAFKRRHPQKVPILLVNFFLGWTFIGWIVALVWSTTKSSLQPS